MSEEQRKAARKIFKAKAVFLIDGAEPIHVRTLEISATGVGIAVASPLASGHTGKIAFNMFFAGKTHQVSATAKVVHCLFSGNEFKAGLLFTQIDAASAGAIALYFQQL